MIIKSKITFFHKFILVCTFFVLCWIAYHMYLEMNVYYKIHESFNLINNIENSLPNKLFEDTIIKASANSCYDGRGVVIGNEEEQNGLYAVVKSGCRFLDFEIYNIEGKAHVGFSSSHDYSSIETNTISLADVLDKLSNCAFTNPPAPNSQDPLFLQFRMKTTEKSIFDDLAIYLESIFSHRLNVNIGSNETELNAYKNKVIAIIYTNNGNRDSTDGNINKIDLQKIYESSRLYNLDNVYHVHNRQTDFRDSYRVNFTKFSLNIKMPGVNSLYEDTNKTQYLNFSKNENGRQIHIVPMHYYIRDEFLADYNEVFDRNMSAYVDTSST